MKLSNIEAKIMDYRSKLRGLMNSHSMRYGLPFVIFVVGGSFGLREFTQLRYQYRPVTTLMQEEVAKEGIEMKKPGEVTLEKEFEKIKKIDIDNWKNVRIPRFWEQDGKET